MEPRRLNFLSIQLVSDRLAVAPIYRKTVKTWLRLPKPHEVGETLNTYVFDSLTQSLRLEISTRIEKDSVIARNEGEIGAENGIPIFNEWVVPMRDITEKYEEGIIEALTVHFSAHQKRQTIKAVELTRNMLLELEIKGDLLVFGVHWSDTEMVAKVGDFLTDSGYSISKYDMETTYEKVAYLHENQIKE